MTMKNKTLLKQVPVLTMAVAASMFVASCRSPETKPPIEDAYGDHLADVKKSLATMPRSALRRSTPLAR